MTTELLEMGFSQGFPFVSIFRKDISATSCIIVNTCYMLNRDDVFEDTCFLGHKFGIKVILLNLPESEHKILHDKKEALKFIEKLNQHGQKKQ